MFSIDDILYTPTEKLISSNPVFSISTKQYGEPLANAMPVVMNGGEPYAVKPVMGSSMGAAAAPPAAGYGTSVFNQPSPSSQAAAAAGVNTSRGDKVGVTNVNRRQWAHRH